MTAEALQAELAATQQRLALSESHGMRLAEALEKLRVDTDQAFKDAQQRTEEAVRMATLGARKDDVFLVDVKTMQPNIFSGKTNESFKCWAKKVKAFCNARKDGFRQALEFVERETDAIDFAVVNSMNWAPAVEANSRLYDLLVMLLVDDALVIAENHQGQGFEAWRALCRRYDPAGEQFMFERMTSLLTRERCRDIGELPGAIEKWMRDLGLYEKKTGKTLEKEWRVPIIFQMIPLKQYSEVKARWQLNSEKDITKFSQELVVWANELRLDQPRTGRGPTPMDLDAMAHDDYTQEQWEEWENYSAECQATVDWVGKGKGKKGSKGFKGKGSKGGKGGKGKCNWCYEDGHHKKDCKKFEQWKKDKDAERKRQGLPPFKPRPRAPAASVEAEGETECEHGADYLGMLHDDLEFDCAALDPQEETENDLDEQARRFWQAKASRAVGATQTATRNGFQVLETDNEAFIDVLGVEEDGEESGSIDLVTDLRETIVGVRTPEPRRPRMAATPTSATSYLSNSSQESLVESMARERRELLEQIKESKESSTPKPLTTSTSRSSSTTSRSSTKASRKRKSKEIEGPPGIEDSYSDNLENTANSVLETKEVEVQTEVHLSHTVRSVTWFPTVDDIHPVYEPVNTVEDEELESPQTAVSDVNDVDSVEVASDKAEEKFEGSEAVEEGSTCPLAAWFLTMLLCLALVVSVMVPKEGDKELNPVSPSTSPGVGSKTKLGPGRARLKKGITVDSAAHHNVMPKRLVRRDRIRESEGSKKGMHYVAANKGKIPNEGETDFRFQTSEGSKENWKFQIAEVNKALGAVSDRVDNDYRVVFDKDSRTGRDASYMLNKKDKKVIKMTRLGNVWVVDAIVDMKDISEGFVRQG